MDQECGDSEYQHGYIHTFRNWAATDKPSSQNDKKRSQRIALGLPVTLNSERKSAVVPTDTLARYVGRCQLTPTISNTITLQEGHLFSQVENQALLELVPESQTKFFMKIGDAEIEFFANPSTQVVDRLVVYQDGVSYQGKKLK